jgi:hypothetical protein
MATRDIYECDILIGSGLGAGIRSNKLNSKDGMG